MGSASGQRGGPSLFNPESAYAGNLANYNAATDWQFKQASPSTMARVGMVSNTLGSFIGSVAGGAMGCWVARAVYGNGDKRWLVFRGWMLNEAPAWFRKLYFKFGPTWAKWVKKSNLLKWVIKLAMDRVVERRQVCPVLDQHQ
jgi:hypothetical protein